MLPRSRSRQRQESWSERARARAQLTITAQAIQRAAKRVRALELSTGRKKVKERRKERERINGAQRFIKSSSPGRVRARVKARTLIFTWSASACSSPDGDVNDIRHRQTQRGVRTARARTRPAAAVAITFLTTTSPRALLVFLFLRASFRARKNNLPPQMNARARTRS